MSSPDAPPASSDHGKRKLRLRPLFWVGLCLKLAIIAGLWTLYFLFQPWIDRNRNYDPYAHKSLSVAGETDMWFERELESGERIEINNKHAMFLADVDPKAAVSERLFPNFAEAIRFAEAEGLDVLPSVSMIHWRLKREEDRLVEAVQLETYRRCVELLRGLEAVLANEGAESLEARAFVHAALQQAGEDGDAPDNVWQRAGELIAEFESGRRSAPRDFNESIVPVRYVRDPELTKAFKTQRFLMGVLNAEAAETFLRIFRKHDSLRAQLREINLIYSALDNPPEFADLHSALEKGEAEGPLYFLPTAQSPENAYFLRRFGGNLPERAGAMDEIVRAIRMGRIDPTPKPESGWYDYKLYALVPLIRKDHSFALATNKLRASELYRGFMEETFRSALSAARETHVMRIEPYYWGVGLGGTEIELAPTFSCEPMPAVYWRLAESYQFIAGQLPQPFGERSRECETVVRSLAAVALLETGIPPDMFIKETLPEGFPQRQAEDGWKWLATLLADPVLTEDPRFQISVANGRKWGAVGVRLRKLEYEYDSVPEVKNSSVVGKPRSYYAPVLVPAEFTRAIPENEFAAFCGKFERVDACLDALGATRNELSEERVSWFALFSWITAFIVASIPWGLWRSTHASPTQKTFKRALYKLSTAATLFLTTVFLFPFLLFHILPRLDLPKWFVAHATFAPEFDDFPKTVNAWIDLAVASALKSNSGAVRQNVLNGIAVSSYDMQETSIAAALDLGMNRSYDEAELLMRCLPHESAGDYGEHMDKIYPILERFDYASNLVLNCAYLIESAGYREKDVELLERMYLQCQEQRNPRTLAFLFQLMNAKPEKLIYDWFVQAGYLPPDSNDLATVPLPSEEVLNALMIKLEYDSQERWKYRLQDPDKLESVRKLSQLNLNDMRIVELFYQICLRAKDHWQRWSAFSAAKHHLGPDARVEFFKSMGEWLINEDPQGPNRDLVLRNLEGFISSCNFNEDEVSLGLIRALYESGIYNDVAKRDYNPNYASIPKTYGEWMENILFPPPPDPRPVIEQILDINFGQQ